MTLRARRPELQNLRIVPQPQFDLATAAWMRGVFETTFPGVVDYKKQLQMAEGQERSTIKARVFSALYGRQWPK